MGVCAAGGFCFVLIMVFYQVTAIVVTRTMLMQSLAPFVYLKITAAHVHVLVIDYSDAYSLM